MEKRQTATLAGGPARNAVATLAGGCFWCTEAIFTRVKGVKKVTPGYTGGTTTNPTYEQVCTGKTGHAEAVQILYDPAIVSYETLLEVFFALHDPTTLNRQGNDVGTQYRSTIFFHNDKQQAAAANMIKKLNEDQRYNRRIVTTLEPYTTLYPAEEHHRDYYDKNSYRPYCQAVIDPKIQKLFKQFPKQSQANTSSGH